MIDQQFLEVLRRFLEVPHVEVTYTESAVVSQLRAELAETKAKLYRTEAQCVEFATKYIKLCDELRDKSSF